MTMDCEAYVLAEHALDKVFKQDEGDIDPYLRRAWEDRICPQLREAARKDQASIEEYGSRLRLMRQLLRDFYEALHSRAGYAYDKPSFLWAHQEPNPLHAGDVSRKFDISRENLLEVASKYLQSPKVQNNAFDWYLIDALVFAEVDAFGYHFMSGAVTGRTNWAWIFAEHNVLKYSLYSLLFAVVGFALRFLLMPAIAIYVGINGHEVLAMSIAGLWIAYVALRLIFLPARWKAKKRGYELLQSVTDAYKHLGSPVISPTRLRNAIEKAVGKGVVFDGAVFAILDRAVKRDPTAFIPFP